MIFEYKVKAKHRLGFKEFKLYATTDIEEFFNRNNIEYVRNMTDTVEHRLLREIERLQDMDKILRNENINLKLRINKAREYIHWRLDDRQDMYITQMEELLEILDKVGDKE